MGEKVNSEKKETNNLVRKTLGVAFLGCLFGGSVVTSHYLGIKRGVERTVEREAEYHLELFLEKYEGAVKEMELEKKSYLGLYFNGYKHGFGKGLRVGDRLERMGDKAKIAEIFEKAILGELDNYKESLDNQGREKEKKSGLEI